MKTTTTNFDDYLAVQKREPGFAVRFEEVGKMIPGAFPQSGGAPAPPKTLIYVRVSTDRQENSPEFQNQFTAEYARAKRMKLGGAALLGPGEDPEVFTDADQSGRTIPLFERRAGRELYQRILRGGVGHLVVTKVDRIARNCRDLLNLVEFLEERKVVLHIVSYGGDSLCTGYFGKLILTILGGVAEFEGSQIADNTKKALGNLRGKRQLVGTIPYGEDCVYRFADGHTLRRSVVLSVAETAALEAAHGACLSKDMEPNESEREVLLRIAKLRWPWWPNLSQKGLSRRKIALQLTAEGVPTKFPTGTPVCVRKAKGEGLGADAAKFVLSTGEWSVGAIAGLLGNPDKPGGDPGSSWLAEQRAAAMAAFSAPFPQPQSSFAPASEDRPEAA